jgi:tRNA threonylcarbamoyladenosine biosynthesis protein TsaE
VICCESDLELPDSVSTESLGARLAPALQAGDLLLLEGPLGAGKTTLVRGLVGGLGGDPAEVCSPTFVLLETYAVRGRGVERVHHADLYRLRGMPSAPWDEVGLGDALEDRAAVTAVEWPETWPSLAAGADRTLRIRLGFRGEGRVAQIAWEPPGSFATASEPPSPDGRAPG